MSSAYINLASAKKTFQMHEMTAIFHDELVENCASINARIHLITLPGSGEKIRQEGIGDVMLS